MERPLESIACSDGRTAAMASAAWNLVRLEKVKRILAKYHFMYAEYLPNFARVRVLVSRNNVLCTCVISHLFVALGRVPSMLDLDPKTGCSLKLTW